MAHPACPRSPFVHSLLLLLLLLVAVASRGAVVEWDGNERTRDIGNRVEILKETNGPLTVQQAADSARAGRYTASQRVVLNFDFSGTPCWLHFTIQNNSPDPLLLVLAQAVLPVADLYYQNDAGQWQRYKAGYSVDLNKKPVRHHYQIFPLAKGPREYYLRLISFSPPVPVRLWNAKAYEVRTTNQKISFGLYAGILLFVVVYNCFLAFSLRRILYLQYASIVFIYLFISASVMDGYLLYFIPNANLGFTYKSLSALVSANVTLYVIYFLELKNYAPRIYKFAHAINAYFILYVVLLFFLPRPFVLLMNQVNAVLVLSYVFTLGIIAGRKGNRMGYYLAAAYFFYYCIVMFEIVYIQTGSPRYLYGISHVSIAILIEAVILAYLLSKRFNWEKEEIQFAKDEMQVQLLKKTQENEQMVRDQNVVLEETVKERTKEIAKQKEIMANTLQEKEGLLKEKEMLLKEIHHRVKNNLQTISSMLLLQGIGLRDEQARKAIAESQHRVRSIALIHQKLYQTDGLEKVELNAFINDLIEQIKSVYDEQANYVTIHRNIPETYLLIDTAIPLGLIFNELFTNSFKYAFKGTKPGLINIELHNVPMEETTEATEGMKRVQLTYWDNGPGLHPANQIQSASTFGLRLINLLSQQIGATLNYQNTEGSKFIFTFNLNM